MYNGARTFALPPQTIRLPLKEPLSLLRGATPTRAAICPRLKLPSSGRWAISVEQSTRPTPGTLRRRSSRARHMGVERISSSRSLFKPSTLESSQPMCSLIWECSLLGAVRNRLRSLVSISMSWRRRSTRPPNSRASASGRGRLGGLTASAKRPRTNASMRSVLASLPTARAKSRTCRGLTIATGRPPRSNSAATGISSAPVASTTTPEGSSALSHSTRPPMPWLSLLNCRTSPLGTTAVSSWVLDTSIPMKSSVRSGVEI